MSRRGSLASATVKRAARLTREGTAFKPLAVYILESKYQNEGVKVRVQQQNMIRTVIALQKIEHKPQSSQAGWIVAVFLAHAAEISGRPACLKVKSTYTLEMYDGALA